MGRKLKLSSLALQDIQKGIDYYNSKQSGLGRSFVNKIQQTFQKILEMPQSASFAYADVRYKVVEIFPYIITYDFDSLAINVFRVFNTNLNPENV